MNNIKTQYILEMNTVFYMSQYGENKNSQKTTCSTIVTSSVTLNSEVKVTRAQFGH